MPELLREQPSPQVALLRIHRPERRNALNMAVRELLADHCRELAADRAVRCLVITGDEKAFAAGADVTELASRTPTDQAFARSRAAWVALEQFPKPVIAAVNGFALGGGCELAMHCDIIIAGESAKLGQPEIKLGIMPGAGGTQRFVRVVGKFAAMRWLLTGDLLSAPKARQWAWFPRLSRTRRCCPCAGSCGKDRRASAPGGGGDQGIRVVGRRTCRWRRPC